MRVVSLLPSATETLCLLGGSRLLVGRSHECDYPPEVQDRPILTGQITDFTTSSAVDAAVSEALAEGTSLYTLNTQLLRDLRPDVILTQDLCEVCSIDLSTVRGAAASMDPQPRIVSLDPHTFEAVLDDVLTVGRAAGLMEEARAAVVGLRERFSRAADHVPAFYEGPRLAFLEWTDPIFVGGHWTPQLVERAGARHSLNPTAPSAEEGAGEMAQGAGRVAGKSRRVTIEEFTASRPERIVICPCGLSLEQTEREAAALMEQAWFRETPAASTEGAIALVDGNQMFNRPGPRLVDAFEWLVGWLNERPDLIPEGFPWRAV
ncbi:MAG: cobalamin-binding protein [Planctomycetota bacterium]|nr:cobalamin-binding protein [Planctomycetota bacterium]